MAAGENGAGDAPPAGKDSGAHISDGTPGAEGGTPGADGGDPSRPKPETPPNSRDDDFFKEVARLRNEVSVDDYAAKMQADDRSQIAITIVSVFRMSVYLIFSLVILGTVGVIVDNRDVTHLWKEAALLFVDFVKTAILPVVTLVLGFYFGRLDRKDRTE